MTTTKRQHPSVLLQDGTANNFYSAMDAYVAQFREELLINREIYRDYAHQNDAAYRAKWQKEIEEQSQAVEYIEKMVGQAKAMYKDVVEEAIRRAAQVMRANGDSHLAAIADALESGDYSRLAI